MISLKTFSGSASIARRFIAFPSSVARINTKSFEKLVFSQHHNNFRSPGISRNGRKTITSRSGGGGTSKVNKENVEAASASAQTGSFLQRWMAHKEIPPRGTAKWYGEMVLICTVFAITGTSTMVMVRPAVSEVLGLKGSLKDGPNSYRICSLVIMTPLYSMMLVVVGTLAGRHAYFRHFAVKMFSRFGIPPELMDKSFHETAKNFRKY